MNPDTIPEGINPPPESEGMYVIASEGIAVYHGRNKVCEFKGPIFLNCDLARNAPQFNRPASDDEFSKGIVPVYQSEAYYSITLRGNSYLEPTMPTPNEKDAQRAAEIARAMDQAPIDATPEQRAVEVQQMLAKYREEDTKPKASTFVTNPKPE